MTARTPKTRVVQVTVTAEACVLWLRWNRWDHRGSATRQNQKHIIVRALTGLEPSDEDLTRYAYALAYWVIDPQKRHIRAPQFLRWQQLGLDGDQTSPHGSEVDDRQMQLEPLPLNGGWPSPVIRPTIMTRPGRKGAAPAKRARASAREPSTRNLTTKRTEQVDGG